MDPALGAATAPSEVDDLASAFGPVGDPPNPWRALSRIMAALSSVIVD
jgi:hypothetical protein